MKSENRTSNASPNALKAYFLASRPKTWIASLSPVMIGTAFVNRVDPLILTLTLLFSLFIQIGTNYANDYFDCMKGADTHLRNGPKRATQEGWIAPKAMLMATAVLFVSAFLVAFPLMLLAGLWSVFLSILCIALGILYTGGPKPLGYLGLGEVFVFLFFGPVATCGSFFLQMKTVSLPVLIASFLPGLLSCSLLIANNLRDEKSDRAANKKTLIVRWGRRFGCWEYTSCVLFSSLVGPILVLAFGAPFSLMGTLLLIPMAMQSIRKVFSFRDPLELIAVLQNSALLLLFATLLFMMQRFH